MSFELIIPPQTVQNAAVARCPETRRKVGLQHMYFSISFPVTLKKESTHTFYIRTVSKYGKVFAIKLLDNAAYAKNEQRELIIGWLLIGILITIIMKII